MRNEVWGLPCSAAEVPRVKGPRAVLVPHPRLDQGASRRHSPPLCLRPAGKVNSQVPRLPPAALRKVHGAPPPTGSRLCVTQVLCPWLICGKAALILTKQKQTTNTPPSPAPTDGRASHRWTNRCLQPQHLLDGRRTVPVHPSPLGWRTLLKGGTPCHPQIPRDPILRQQKSQGHPTSLVGLVSAAVHEVHKRWAS